MVKARFTVRISKELNEKLEAEARRLGISKARLVEIIVARYFNEDPPDERIHTVEELWKRIRKLEERLSEIEAALGRRGAIDRFIKRR